MFEGDQVDGEQLFPCYADGVHGQVGGGGQSFIGYPEGVPVFESES